jgi:hypothetical protein
MKGFESLDLGEDCRFDNTIACEETVMNFAVSASRVGDLIQGQVNDPVLNVTAASEREDNRF